MMQIIQIICASRTALFFFVMVAVAAAATDGAGAADGDEVVMVERPT